MKKLLLWHYTIVSHLSKIQASGTILPATTYLPPGVKPAVWCSTNPVWEETANKNLGTADGSIRFLNRQETDEHFGLARIAVRPEAAPLRWADYRRLSGDAPEMCRSLVKAAKERHARPDEWRCTFEPIPSSDWLGIEVWDGETWVPAPEVMP
jgi:hypothetical protein